MKRLRRKIRLLFGSVLMLSGVAQAQSHGYIFVGPTLNNGEVGAPTNFGILPPPASSLSTNQGSSNTFSAGIGAEWRLSRWLGLGADLGSIVPGGGKVIDNTVGTFSPDLYLHLGKWPQWRWFHQPSAEGGREIDLYGAAGYTAVFQTYGANAFNWAVGMNYWFQTRGVMVEFRRVQVEGSNSPVTGSPYSEIRVGFIFRRSSP